MMATTPNQSQRPKLSFPIIMPYQRIGSFRRVSLCSLETIHENAENSFRPIDNDDEEPSSPPPTSITFVPIQKAR